MIFIGGRPAFLFKTRRGAAKRDFRLAFDGRFNLLLYADYTAVIGGRSEKVCFVVPVHYPSFALTLGGKIPVEKSIDRLLVFESSEARETFCSYVASLRDRRAAKIPFLK